MITLQTNAQQYANDIAEVIRAYLGFVEIVFHEAIPDKCVDDFKATLVVWLRPEGVACVDVVGQNENGTSSAYTYPIRETTKDALQQKREEKRALKIALFRCLRQLYPDKELPWGSCTGIRPTKLLRDLMEREGRENARRMFREEFDVSPDKAALAECIVDAQRHILQSADRHTADIYVGIPFCRTRCLYCSFASEVVPQGGVPEAYLQALFEDIRLGAGIMQKGGYTARSLYIGGGTPTVLTGVQLGRLLAHLDACYGLDGMELTVEAGRPDTLDFEKLRILRDAGVSRISLNPQSMHAQTLTRIGRMHTPEDIVSSLHMARELHFPCINMDLIAGLPGETPADMQNSLDAIAALKPENLTIHTLAVKRSSKLKETLSSVALCCAEDVALMVQMGASYAEKLGMHPYYMYRQKYMSGNLENVGYTLPGYACVYNIDMMEEEVSIMAHGAGAMSKRVFPGRDIRVERIPAPKDVKTYCAKVHTLAETKQALFLQ